MLLALSAVSLSAGQRIERDLFGSSARLQIPWTTDGDASTAASVVGALDDRGTNGLVAMTTITELDVGKFGDQAVLFHEGPWSTGRFARRFVLTSGSWPTRPGEVVISRDIDTAGLTENGRLPALAGRSTFTVVGTVIDPYERDSAIVLAAQGTATTLNWEAADRSGSRARGQTQVFWDEPDPATTIAALEAELGVSLRDVAVFAVDYQRLFPTWIELAPAGYRIPARLLPILAALAAFGLIRRDERRRAAIMRAIGAPRRLASNAVALAVAAACITTALGGLIAGTLGGLAARELLARRQMLSPMQLPVAEYGNLLLGVIVGCGVGWAATWIGGNDTPALAQLGGGHTPSRRTRWLASARRPSAVVLGALALARGRSASSLLEVATVAAPLTIVTLLVLPDVIRFLARQDAGTHARLRLALRRIEADRARCLALAALVAVTIGGSITLAVLTESGEATQSADAISRVAPGHLLIEPPDGRTDQAPPQPLVDAVMAEAPADAPTLTISYVRPASGRLELEGGSGRGSIIAVATPDEAQSLADGALSARQISTLADGGMLVWDGGGDGTRELFVTDGTGTHRFATLPVVDEEVATAYQAPYGHIGLVLTTTADSLSLATQPARLLITHLTDSEIADLKQTAIAAGYSTTLTRSYDVPEPSSAPLAIRIAVFGLLAILLVATTALMYLQANALRGYAGSLIALGLTPSWTRRTVAIQLGALAATGVGLTSVLVLAPVLVAGANSADLDIVIPWTTCAAVLALMVGLMYASIRLGLRHVTAAHAAPRWT